MDEELVPPYRQIQEAREAADEGDYAKAFHLLADVVQSMAYELGRSQRL